MERQDNNALKDSPNNNTLLMMESGDEIVKISKMNGYKYTNGPDQIIPADKYINTRPGGHVKLRMGTRGITGEIPVSVPGLLRRAAVKYPDTPALVSKKDGLWHRITFSQYQDRVRTVAKAFIKLGLERFNSVCILGFNSPEWFISDMAAIHAGGYACGVYTTNSADACCYCLESSRANICVVQDKKQLDKILSVKSKLPHLKAIIQWEQPVDTDIPDVYTWDQLFEIGKKESDAQLDHILSTMSVNECCTLVYTSGTTSQPKAVMLSHDNLTWDALAIVERVGDLRPADEKLVSFLPLSHVAAQVVDIYVTLTNCSPVYFAQPDALKGSIIETLKEVRPTRFLAVPRLWEKMYEKLTAVGASNGYIKRMISTWAKSKATEYHMSRVKGISSESLGYRIARALIFSKVKAALGLDQCTTFVTAAAPLATDIKKYFLSLDIVLMDAFGMSEASGAHTLSSYNDFNLESAGLILDGVETMFEGSPGSNGPGEICMRGRHVFMGYLHDEEKTLATMNPEGWLMSGDIGKCDNRNFLYITGRIKEIIITAGGENVAPIIIEQAVCSELPQIGYAVLIGDRRKFLSILLTLKSKVDPHTAAPLDELDNETVKWIATLGSKATKTSEIIASKDPKVYKAIEEGIARANKNAISNAQKVQKFAILPTDFSMHTGELGPTMKLKRNVIYEKYGDIIEDFYKDH